MDKENIVIKLAVDGDLETIQIVDGQSKICNWLYNHLLEQAKQLRDQFCKTQDANACKTLYTERGLRNLLPGIKKENPFLKVVHSSPLKNTALRLSSAIQAHQKSKKGKRLGKRVNFPKFRSWKKQWFSLFYDEPNKGFYIEGQKLLLSLGMGEDRKHRSISLNITEAHLLKDKTIRNLRISSENGKYFAIFTIQKKLPQKKQINKVIALDPNHKNLCYGVDTDSKAVEIASPAWLKTYDKRIDELKGKRDHCLRKSKKLPVLDQKGKEIGKDYFLPSRRWRKFNNAMEKTLRKRREQTKTFMYAIANRLFQDYDCVAIGDYVPHGGGISKKMRRAMNNRSLIGRFKSVLSWVAKKSGKTYFEYDEKGTTRTCSACLNVVQEGIDPSCRQWQCAKCKTLHIRDENSAITGLRNVLRDFSTNGEIIVSQVPSSGLVLIKERWAWCARPSGVHCMSRGQSSELIAASRN